jgi:hypothetical protein
MKVLSEKILKEIESVKPQLLAISPESARTKPDADNWSRQEILGHLIDSALNNHQRFVRGGYNAAVNFPPYDQNRWVEIQGYNERDWLELIELWVLCNRHLCQVLDRLPEDVFQNPCSIGKDSPVTLEFIMGDYLRHLKMHMEQILQKPG